MSTIVGAEIYTGAWVDWSRGAILGSTITLSSRSSSILLAFLALFVTIIGSCLWRILSFMVHQLSASPDAKDAIHHQHQLIFRNTGSPAEATRSFLDTAWHWRNKGRRSFSRSLPLALLSLIYLLAFAAASILTSLVTRAAGSQRLIVSDDCGFFAYDPAEDVTARTVAMQAKDLNDTLLAATYARQCYNEDSDMNKMHCGFYTKPFLEYNSSDVDCPFDASICAVSKGFQLDTGLIDSHHDLGINTPESERVGFRRVTTCAPLRVDGDFVTVETMTAEDTEGLEGDKIRSYHYGTYAGIGLGENTTYLYNEHAIIDGFGYEFTATAATLESTLWQPIDELVIDDADLTLLFFAPNSVKYGFPTGDPFFRADFFIDLPSVAGVNLSYYTSTEFVNVMACKDQYQYCNGNDESKCTALTGYQQAWADLNSTRANLNDVQYTVASRIALNSRALSMYYSIGGRGAQALRAQDTIIDRVQQIQLPDNQWQIEVEGWFSVALAKLQRTIVEYAAPSISRDSYPKGSYLMEPFDTFTQDMCRNQKVTVQDETVSFSVLGISIIFAIGALIIIPFLVLEPLTALIQRCLNCGEYRRIRWVMDDKMQVQRMAFEEAGMGGTWTNLGGTVPVADGNEKFFDLHGVDFQNPRLGSQFRSTKLDTNPEIQFSPTMSPQPAVGIASAMPVMAFQKPFNQVYHQPAYQPLAPQGH